MLFVFAATPYFALSLVLIDALDGRIVLPRIDFTQSGLKILDSGTADSMYTAVSCGREQEKGRRLLTNSALRPLDQRAPQDTSKPGHPHLRWHRQQPLTISAGAPA